MVSLPTGGGLEGVITTGREEGQKLPCIFETHPPPPPDDTSLSSTGSQLLWSKKYVLIADLEQLATFSMYSVSRYHFDFLDLIVIGNVFSQTYHCHEKSYAMHAGQGRIVGGNVAPSYNRQGHQPQEVSAVQLLGQHHPLAALSAPFFDVDQHIHKKEKAYYSKINEVG